jgi:galactose mutarotase-like enzyme
MLRHDAVMADLVTIASEALIARINPLGAELLSLTDPQGRQYMTDGNPTFWTGHAPVLFPIVGELNGGHYRLGDRTYPLGRHGFARRSRFEVIEASGAAARFRLTDSEETRAVYPFAFVLTLGFALDGATLHIEAIVANPGDAPLPFSLGFHPGFAWPLPGGCAKGAHVVSFAEAEPEPIRRLSQPAGLLLPEPCWSPVDGHHFIPAASLFEADAMIWDRLASRAVTFGAPGGAQIALAFPDMPMLGIWQKPGAPFLCIEPWQGIADPEGFEGDFREKPGVVELEPGGEKRFRMDVTVIAG